MKETSVQEKQRLQATAIRMAVSFPAGRSLADHRRIVWQNFCDAFTDKQEFLNAIDALYERSKVVSPMWR